MRKKIYVFCMLLGLFVLTACGNTEEDRTKQVENTKEAVSTEAVVTTEKEIAEDNTTQATTTEAITTEEITTEEETPGKGILVVIDPGHQGPNVDMSAMEPNAPDSSQMKQKATGGTVGKFTGIGEYQLNLDISLQLREALQEEGYDVILTREDNDTAISNAERATLANEAGADISVRIHANGSEDSGANGALVLIGSAENAYVGDLYDDSHRLAECVLNNYCAATGMQNLGIQTNDTMTGINWSQIPVVILEMGFMTNEQDDRNMQDRDYQQNMVAGIVDGINEYYGY